MTAIGRDIVQGYFTGRPMTVDFFNNWLSDRAAAAEFPRQRVATDEVDTGVYAS